jgi:hypothetical protein
MPGEAHARSKRGICGAKQRNVPFRARRCTKWLALVMSSRPPLAVRPYSGGSGRVQNNPSRSAHADSTKTSNCGENPRSTAERHLDFSSLPRPFRSAFNFRSRKVVDILPDARLCKHGTAPAEGCCTSGRALGLVTARYRPRGVLRRPNITARRSSADQLAPPFLDHRRSGIAITETLKPAQHEQAVEYFWLDAWFSSGRRAPDPTCCESASHRS